MAGSEGAAVAVAAAGRDGVGKSCEAAACKLRGRSALRLAAAAVVGAVRSVLVRGGVCDAAGALGKGRQGGRGGGDTVLGMGGGNPGSAELSAPQSHSAGGESGGRAGVLRPGRGGRAASRERCSVRPGGRAPTREARAGRAPSDPQGAGCRNSVPPRGSSSACRSLSGCSRGPGSLVLPGALCLPGAEQPRSRGTRAVGFGAMGD